MYNQTKIKISTIQYLEMYRDQRILDDDFFAALLCNDLKAAVLAADDENFETLGHIVGWCYNELPSIAWGSEENVKEWISNNP